MKRSTIGFICLLSALVALPTTAQDHSRARVFRSQNGRALTAPSMASHSEIINSFLVSKGRSQEALEVLVIGDSSFVERNGVTHHRITQRVEGLRVHGAYSKIAIDQQGRVVNAIEKLVNPSGRVITASIGNNQALDAVFAELYGNDVPKFFRQPTVERVAIPGIKGSLSEGFLVETWTDKDNLLHHTLIGGNGEVLHVELRTNNDSYSVFTDNPDDTPQTTITGPGTGITESPNGWVYGGNQSTVDIAGNNVNAYLDTTSSNSSDGGGSTVSNGNFNTAIDLSSQPGTTGNKAVAVQNLFYLNNIMHDKLYKHGFNEAARNFQESNFGNGGIGSDSVNAEAQDGSGTNNANFSTPSDGSNPRMQMFLFEGIGDHLATVGPNSYLAMGAEFGPALSASGVTAPIVIVNDGTGTTSDACESINNDLSNSIALIDRGSCDFVTKVGNAQAAGALGAIVANNAGDGILTMGGTDNSITISSIFVGQSDGAAIAAAAGSNAQIGANPNPPLMRDGDFDSDIVYHEYGHGLTWRMIGSMSGAMSGAIGEGMGDVLSILMNDRDTVGTYATSDSRGIRREPYTGYSLTYGGFTGNEVHDDGEIYAAAVWNVWQVFQANGVAKDFLWDYLIDGMNYTPAGPDMDDMRDGILQSAAGSGHECLIWQGFAEYGIGEGASARKRGRRYTITESFTVPSSCSGGFNNSPTATFTFNCTDLSCSFDGSGSSDSDGTITGYSWNFGDGNTASGATPSHSYSSAGTYNVTLTVTDDGGATGNTSQGVTVTTSGGGDTTAPVITNVSSQDGKGNKFTITWSTDEPASSDLILNGTLYASSTLVASHSRTFNGSRGVLYTYTVSSTDAAGNNATDGPYQHQN